MSSVHPHRKLSNSPDQVSKPEALMPLSQCSGKIPLPTGFQRLDPRSLRSFRQFYDTTQFSRMYGRASEAVSTQVCYKGGQCVNIPTWPEEAISRLQSAESQKPSMDSFLGLLSRPISERPSTLGECIDFFYPESGVLSFFSTNTDAFVGSNPFRYTLDTDLIQRPGNVPLQLGEMSMMYGWFILYRMLLCPSQNFSQIPTSPDKIFTKMSEVSLLDARVSEDVQRYRKDQVDKLKRAYAVVGALKTLNSAAARGDFDSVDGINDIVNELQKQGMAYIVSYISNAIGVPSKYVTTISSFLLEGSIPPAKLAQILELEADDPNLVVLKNIVADRFIEGVHTATGIPKNTLLDVSTADSLVKVLGAKVIDDGFREDLKEDLKSVAASVGQDKFNKMLAWIESEVQNYSRSSEPYTQFRSNPVPLVITLGAAVMLAYIQSELNEDAADLDDYMEFIKAYFSNHIYALNEDYVKGLQYPFEFSDHVLKGSAGFGFERRTCELMQGGEMLDYWTSVLSGFQPYILKMYQATTNPKSRGGKAHADIITDCLQNPNTMLEFIDRFSTDTNVFRCPSMNYLAEHAYRGAFKVLETLPDFSPFTHAFGFSPIYNNNVIDGRPARTYLGPDNGPICADPKTKKYLFGLLEQAQGVPCYPAAGPNSDNFARSSVSAYDVECYVGVTPLPSRRRLEGKFGGRASVSFDVAFTSNFPVMDAQYVALMSVLLCYREARDTIRHSSLSWKNQLPPEPMPFIRVPTRTMNIAPSAINTVLNLRKDAVLQSRIPIFRTLHRFADISEIEALRQAKPLTWRIAKQNKTVSASSSSKKLFQAGVIVVSLSILGALTYKLSKSEDL